MMMFTGCKPNHNDSETPPVAPSELNIVIEPNGERILTWNDNSNNEEGFTVWLTKSDNDIKKETIPADETFFSFGILGIGLYSASVCSFNVDGNSKWISVEFNIEGTNIENPENPSNLQATPISHTAVTVTWNDNSDNEDNFILQYSKMSDFSEATEAIPTINTTSESIETLDANTKYYFLQASAVPD